MNSRKMNKTTENAIKQVNKKRVKIMSKGTVKDLGNKLGAGRYKKTGWPSSAGLQKS